jgi:hypothetical protein
VVTLERGPVVLTRMACAGIYAHEYLVFALWHEAIAWVSECMSDECLMNKKAEVILL